MKKILLLLILVFQFSTAQKIEIHNNYFKIIFDKQLNEALYTYEVLEPNLTYDLFYKTSLRLDKNLCRKCQPQLLDFAGDTIYDRGHLVCKRNASYSKDMANFCNYYTNILPQDYRLNRGQWRDLENFIFNLMFINGYEIEIWSGQDVGFRRLGKLKIPLKFWKLIKVNNNFFAWSFPNENLGFQSFQDFSINPNELINKINAIGLEYIEQ